ncbi:hypothetical protein [Nocardioides dongkuii]|uniref:hypothetical protein n=1 Tax=Nocardioides dongkuii TaxID=2760089 RepID=UPI0015F7BEE7|nr:hypothetical protein [Nocardioides dongkuii]
MTEPDQHDGRETPPPPRSPLREDQADAPMAPIEGAKEPGPEVDRVTKRDDSHDIPPVTGDPDLQQDASGRDAQEENAETSLDQPSH